ncbi:MAG: hypothetical protein JWM99_4442 [Verrucomicrobiales bacterium]|nr:hypothetical protein [Verrucomicrobiales bacterium]
MNGINTTIQIDRSGRLVLPKALRERFRLECGDRISVEVKGDAIELRPRKQAHSLKRINGVLVFSSESLPADRDFVAEDREDRIQELLRRGGINK